MWDKQHPGSTWNGSPQDYVNLLKTAYLNIKAVEPNAKVYLSGLTYFWDYEAHQEQYLARLLALIAADPEARAHHFYFDGVTYHLYYKPQMIYDLLSEVHAMLTVYGLRDTPIWLAETNAAPTNDPQEMPHFQDLPYQVTLTEQAAFIIQLHALAFAADVERVQIYKLFNSSDFPEDPRPFGLLRGDKSPRPAFTAYQTMTRYLAGFQTVQLYRQGEVTQLIFQREHDSVTVMWNAATTPRQVPLPAMSNTVMLVNEIGITNTLTVTNGHYTLDLPPAECSGGDCFIGGAPRFIIQSVAPTSFTVMPTLIAPNSTAAPATKRQLAAFTFDAVVAFGLLITLVWGWLRRANF